MTKTKQIIKAIKENNITSDIAEMMKKDIREIEIKQIQVMINNIK